MRRSITRKTDASANVITLVQIWKKKKMRGMWENIVLFITRRDIYRRFFISTIAWRVRYRWRCKDDASRCFGKRYYLRNVRIERRRGRSYLCGRAFSHVLTISSILRTWMSNAGNNIPFRTRSADGRTWRTNSWSDVRSYTPFGDLKARIAENMLVTILKSWHLFHVTLWNFSPL